MFIMGYMIQEINTTSMTDKQLTVEKETDLRDLRETYDSLFRMTAERPSADPLVLAKWFANQMPEQHFL